MQQSSFLTDRATTDYRLQWTNFASIFGKIFRIERTFAASTRTDNRLDHTFKLRSPTLVASGQAQPLAKPVWVRLIKPVIKPSQAKHPNAIL